MGGKEKQWKGKIIGRKMEAGEGHGREERKGGKRMGGK